MVSTVEANISNEQPNSKWDYSNNLDEPISFTERGIKFFIFTDGQLDFDVHGSYGTTTEYYYKGTQRKANARHNRRGTRVVRDYRGRVIRVGRVFINYTYRGKVSRVGTVFISYRRGKMTRVGGLKIIYRRHGIRFIGSVKPRRYSYNTGYYDNYYYDDYVYEYEDDFFNDDDFHNDYEQFNEDDDYYYYRSKARTSKKTNGKTTSKKQMIKRKKGISKVRTPVKKKVRRGSTR